VTISIPIPDSAPDPLPAILATPHGPALAWGCGAVVLLALLRGLRRR
jgi:hypothetical protein